MAGSPGFFEIRVRVCSSEYACIQNVCWYGCWYGEGLVLVWRGTHVGIVAMPTSTNMLLSDAACSNAKPTAPAITKLSDGRGLQLWVHPNGSKLWRLAYRFGRKQKLLSLGPY